LYSAPLIDKWLKKGIIFFYKGDHYEKRI